MATRGTERAAVLAPGGGYSTDGPLLMYAGLAVERRGGYVHRIAWTQPLPRLDAETHAWVASQVAAALDETAAATGATARVVIGKSLGSLAAPLVGRSWPSRSVVHALADRRPVALAGDGQRTLLTLLASSAHAFGAALTSRPSVRPVPCYAW